MWLEELPMRSISLCLAGALVFASLVWASDNTMPGTSDLTPAVDSSEARFSRWLDLNALSFSMRYRSMDDSRGYHLMQFGQERSIADGRVKLDREGKYSVHFHLSSGGAFNWAYADVMGGTFGGQINRSFAYLTPQDMMTFYMAMMNDSSHYINAGVFHSGGWTMKTRQLYLSASPIKQIELQYGSLGISRGFDTEMTTYDDDGYIAGERLRILDPKHLYLDEISATFAYEGDIYDPNFFTRGDRLLQSNYHQFLVAKRFGKRIGVSADFTGDKHTHTMREGVLVKMSESRVLDSFRLETYQRTNDVTWQGLTFESGSGFGFTGSKTIAKRVRLEGGYASIDNNYGVLEGSRLLATFGFSMNGDAYLVGSRAFGRANVQLTPYFTLFGYFTHLTSTPANVISANQQAYNFGATIDFQDILANKFHLIAPAKANE